MRRSKGSLHLGAPFKWGPRGGLTQRTGLSFYTESCGPGVPKKGATRRGRTLGEKGVLKGGKFPREKGPEVSPQGGRRGFGEKGSGRDLAGFTHLKRLGGNSRIRVNSGGIKVFAPRGEYRVSPGPLLQTPGRVKRPTGKVWGFGPTESQWFSGAQKPLLKEGERDKGFAPRERLGLEANTWGVEKVCLNQKGCSAPYRGEKPPVGALGNHTPSLFLRRETSQAK